MKLFKRLASGLITVGVVVALPVVWAQRQDISDWYQLRDYSPPVEVAALATDTTMNPDSRKLFYINKPVIADEKEFNDACSQNEASIVLGCYIPRKGIFLFDVKDPRLTGVKEVTAAHELLHAAYERLSSSERAEVDRLTAQAFAEANSQRINATVEKYRAHDPSVVPNELHSIIGTEVRNIPPALETYYQRYFTNRVAVVDYSDRYEKEFDSRMQTAEGLKKQIEQLKAVIDGEQNEISLQYEALKQSRQRINDLEASGDITARNNLVAPFNNQVNEYNRLVTTAQQNIDKHNQLVEQVKDLQVEILDLYQKIDSREDHQPVKSY